MNCNEINPSLYLLADGELPVADPAAVKEHLNECEKCRELLHALRQENEILGDITAVPSWEPERLETLKQKILEKTEPFSFLQEFRDIAANCGRMVMPIVFVFALMQLFHINFGTLYKLMQAGFVMNATRNLIYIPLMIWGLAFMFFLLKFGCTNAPQKRAI